MASLNTSFGGGCPALLLCRQQVAPNEPRTRLSLNLGFNASWLFSKGNVSVSIPSLKESLTLPAAESSAGVKSFTQTIHINVRAQRQALSSPPS